MQKLMQEIQVTSVRENAMLESMAISLRSGLDFSFNNNDMADLLDRLRKDQYAHLLDEDHA